MEASNILPEIIAFKVRVFEVTSKKIFPKRRYLVIMVSFCSKILGLTFLILPSKVIPSFA